MLTNSFVQEKFSWAIDALMCQDRGRVEELALSILQYFKAYSASGNEIPGLRGSGLKRGVGSSRYPAFYCLI